MTSSIEIRGAGRGTPYLFVHGTPGDRTSFARLIDRAPLDAKLILLDLPDHGASSDDHAAALAPCEQAVLEAAGAAADGLTVVGHSFGGWIVARLSPRLRELGARRAVLVSAFDTFTDQELGLREALLGQLERGELTAPALAEMVVELFLGDARTAELEPLVRAQCALPTDRWVRVLRRVLRIGAEPPAACELPTRVVYATRDGAVPAERALALALASRDTDPIAIDTSSHLLPLTHDERVARAVFAA